MTINMYSIVSFVYFVSLASCASPSSSSWGPQRVGGGQSSDDNQIIASVKADIYNDPILQPMLIRVDSRGGVVELNGLIDTLQNKIKLEELARHEHGVVSVQDNLIMR